LSWAWRQIGTTILFCESVLVVVLASRLSTEEQAEGGRMKNVGQLLKKLLTEDSGQDLIEYALVAALIGLGSVAAL